jgi:hypothetical protein
LGIFGISGHRRFFGPPKFDRMGDVERRPHATRNAASTQQAIDPGSIERHGMNIGRGDAQVNNLCHSRMT